MNPYADVDELSSLLKKRSISSVELTKLYLERLEKFGETLGAVVTITRERALKEAAAADREIGEGKIRGPLHGIPYGVKDLLATRGIPTTWGAEPYRDQVFDYDATVVERLGKAGAVLVAKLAMVELAGGFGYNTADASFTGPGRTPWNTGFWSGGSSSGPGAATAAALVPFSIGSETSGSILTPSAFSGVTGLRPTYGLVSRHGAMALSWTLDKVGPIARSARTCAAVLRAIAGRDPKDESSVPKKLDWTSKRGKVRIGIIPASWARTQPAVRDNFLATLEVLKSLGHTTKEISLSDMPYGQVVGTIVDAEGASAFEDILVNGKAKQLRVLADRTGGYESASTLAVDYLRAMRVRKKIRLALVELLTREVDVIAAPTRATVAYPIGPKFEDIYKGISGCPSLIGAMNVAGAPAIAFPNGFGENGLPTSAQLIAAPFREPLLVQLAGDVQMKTDFHRRQPPQFA